MKLAIVTPPCGFTTLEETGLGYHLVLAQKLLVDEAYREYYKALSGYGHFIIVDNGAAESDTPPFDEVVKVANYIDADEIVLPDVVCDKRATLDALARWRPVWTNIPPHKRFVVPQGRTYAEWFDCLQEILVTTYVATVGVSKYFPQDRFDLLRQLREEAIRLGEYPTHVLGLVDNPLTEVERLSREFPWVRGVDTGAPIAWAQQNRSIREGLPRCSLSWDLPVLGGWASYNIEQLRRAAIKGSAVRV